MQSAMTVAIAKAGVVRAPAQELVKLRDGAKLVIIFSLPRRHVPAGIQVLHVCGGPTSDTAQQEAPKDTRFSKAEVDLDGLMQRVSVDVINVCEGERGFCRVYVNCTVGVGGKFPGFKAWTGLYEDFVRGSIERICWNRAILRSTDAKTSLELRKPLDAGAEMKIRFAIEH